MVQRIYNRPTGADKSSKNVHMLLSNHCRSTNTNLTSPLNVSFALLNRNLTYDY